MLNLGQIVLGHNFLAGTRPPATLRRRVCSLTGVETAGSEKAADGWRTRLSHVVHLVTTQNDETEGLPSTLMDWSLTRAFGDYNRQWGPSIVAPLRGPS
jgi:hypothetical protein